MQQSGPYISSHGLDIHGIHNVVHAYWNLDTPQRIEESVRRHEGVIAQGGPLVVRTGQHTGRSANDKYIVKEPGSDAHIWWGKSNTPIAQEKFAGLRARMLAYLQGRELFVQDLWGGADPSYRLGVRVVTESAWHSLFIRNLLIEPKAEELPGLPAPVHHHPCAAFPCRARD